MQLRYIRSYNSYLAPVNAHAMLTPLWNLPTVNKCNETSCEEDHALKHDTHHVTWCHPWVGTILVTLLSTLRGGVQCDLCLFLMNDVASMLIIRSCLMQHELYLSWFIICLPWLTLPLLQVQGTWPPYPALWNLIPLFFAWLATPMAIFLIILCRIVYVAQY